MRGTYADERTMDMWRQRHLVTVLLLGVCTALAVAADDGCQKPDKTHLGSGREDNCKDFTSTSSHWKAAEWHSSKETRTKLEEFHQKKARFPQEGLDAAKSLETTTLMLLRDHMKTMSEFRVREFQYAGSIYEGLKIGSPDEFDIMVIIDAPDIDALPTDFPGFFRLQPTGVSRYKKAIVGGFISSRKILDAFFGFVVRALKALQLHNETTPRRHGPAVQIDMEKLGIKFSIDVVPTFMTRSGELYVTKTPKSVDHLWRRSTSFKEKEILKTIDRGNGIRRKCVRILKGIKETEPNFAALESYHFKTALFHVNKEQLSWAPSDLGPRVIDLLLYIRGCLENGRMSHFFLPEMNILREKNYENLIKRIERLTSDKEQFYKLIHV